MGETEAGDVLFESVGIQDQNVKLGETINSETARQENENSYKLTAENCDQELDIETYEKEIQNSTINLPITNLKNEGMDLMDINEQEEHADKNNFVVENE